jgi:hypothetical protein
MDKRAKGSDLRNEFKVSPVEAPSEKPGLNGQSVWVLQTLQEESSIEKMDEKKDGKIKEESGEKGETKKKWRGGFPTLERKVPWEWFRANMAAEGKKSVLEIELADFSNHTCILSHDLLHHNHFKHSSDTHRK